MNKLMNIARRFREEETGAAMVEYSILIGIVAAASISAIIAIGGWVGGQFTSLCSSLNGSGAGGATGTACAPK